MKTITLTEADIYKGPLLLVNALNPLRTDAPVMLTPLSDDETVWLELKTAALLRQLLLTLQSGGQIVPVSGYRSRDEQERLYSGSLKENGAAFTRRYVALPDCSEHQTGLAVDMAEASDEIDPIRPVFPDTGVCGQFRSLAAKYGFIERYRKDKERLTGISSEPWHFRYVGYPHAALMEEMDLCLEEYIALLKAFPCDGTHLFFDRTEIFYADADRALRGLTLPDDATQVSGNNIDGFIVTIWRGRT